MFLIVVSNQLKWLDQMSCWNSGQCRWGQVWRFSRKNPGWFGQKKSWVLRTIICQLNELILIPLTQLMTHRPSAETYYKTALKRSIIASRKKKPSCYMSLMLLMLPNQSIVKQPRNSLGINTRVFFFCVLEIKICFTLAKTRE